MLEEKLSSLEILTKNALLYALHGTVFGDTQNVVISRNLTATTLRLSIMETLYTCGLPTVLHSPLHFTEPRLHVKENATVQAADAGVTLVTDSKLWTQRSR